MAIVYLDTSPLCVWYKRRVRTSRSKAGNRGIRRRPRPVPWKCVCRVRVRSHILALLRPDDEISFSRLKPRGFSVENALQHLQDKSLTDYPAPFLVHSTTGIIPLEWRFNVATFFRSIYRNSWSNFRVFFYARVTWFRAPCGFFDWQWFIPVRRKCTRPNAYRVI